MSAGTPACDLEQMLLMWSKVWLAACKGRLAGDCTAVFKQNGLLHLYVKHAALLHVEQHPTLARLAAAALAAEGPVVSTEVAACM